jgi:hypothetical protein
MEVADGRLVKNWMRYPLTVSSDDAGRYPTGKSRPAWQIR